MTLLVHFISFLRSLVRTRSIEVFLEEHGLYLDLGVERLNRSGGKPLPTINEEARSPKSMIVIYLCYLE